MEDDGEEDSVRDLADQLNRPPDVAIQQQRIKAWHPILDPEWMIYGYLVLAVILIPLGKSCCMRYYMRSLAVWVCCSADMVFSSSTNSTELMFQHRL